MELPTMRTAVIMITFITDERPPMLAFLTATIKNEASASGLLVPFRRFGPVYGMRHLMIVSETILWWNHIVIPKDHVMVALS
jgi:hypothetical protein